VFTDCLHESFSHTHIFFLQYGDVRPLMETTFIRVGNEEYARENHSYGLTTMRNHHVQVNGSTITFRFQGKSKIRHTLDLHDRRLARIIQRCQDIPGYELFQYLDSEGEPQSIDSADVNEYLQEISHEDFTAKDFRTWAGTVLACMTLREFEAFESETQAKKNVVQAIKTVAARLGNTPSVCRKCYVHPAVLESYMSGRMKIPRKRKNQYSDMAAALEQEEVALLRLLRERTK
jgi:DNA topoisomerase I